MTASRNYLILINLKAISFTLYPCDNVGIYEFPHLCYLRIRGYCDFEIFSLAVGANKITSFGWMIAKDETEPRDETIENVRGYQTFILRKSTNTSLHNV